MDWLRQVHFYKRCKRFTIFVIISSIFTRHIYALDSYTFRLGTNATIPFSCALDKHSQYTWKISKVGVSDPFNINGTMKPDALNPSQRARLNVSTNWGENVLQVDLHIRNISKIDRGVYLWAVLQHTIRVKRSTMTFDVFVDVILPTGRAKCDIRDSPYSLGLREAHCKAVVGSDGGGLLICYQNDVKTPFQSPPSHSATHVSAVFWMDAQYDIKCCSHEANYEKVPGDCDDFTKDALIESEIQTPKITSRPLSTTLKNNGKPVSASSPIESEHFTDSPSSTEDTKLFSCDQCVCNEYKHDNNVKPTTIYILLIILGMSVCINIATANYFFNGCSKENKN